MTNDNKQPDVREAFEAHQLSRYQYADITRDADGRYWNVPMESEWETWQAALQSPSVSNTPQESTPTCDQAGVQEAVVYLLCVDQQIGLYEFVRPEHVADLEQYVTVEKYYKATPTVDAAVEALRQAAIYELEAIYPDSSPLRLVAKGFAEKLRALPGSTSALDEYVEAKCMEVAEAINNEFGAAKHYEHDLRTIVQSVIRKG